MTINHQITYKNFQDLMRDLVEVADLYRGTLHVAPGHFVTFRNIRLMYAPLHGTPCVVLESRKVPDHDTDRLNVRIAYVHDGCTCVGWVEHWYLEPWTEAHESAYHLSTLQPVGGGRN